MKPRTKNIVKGAGREVKGKVKEAAGAVTGNDRLKIKGKIEGAVGHAQRKVGEAERDFDREASRDID